MSIRRKLPVIPKSADAQTRAFFSAAFEIISELTRQLDELTGANAGQVAGKATSAQQVNGITKSSLGLGNVDNTPDEKKPVSKPQQQALSLKLDRKVFENYIADDGLIRSWDVANDDLIDIGARPGNTFKVSGAGTYNGTTLNVGDYVRFYLDEANVLQIIPYRDGIDIPDLDWAKITTGKPTTLAGYGITDAATQAGLDELEATVSNLESEVNDLLQVPAPPASGTYVLQAVDGVLSWTVL